MMELDTGQRTLLEMKKENVKELAQLLKTVAFKEYGNMCFFETGIKLTVDDGALQQANAYMNSAFFNHLKVREQDIKIKLPVKSVQEFLSIPEGTSNQLKMSFSGIFEPLKLLIEDDGCVVRGMFKTAVADPQLEFDFDVNTVPVMYLLKTQVLKDIFKDFDETSNTVKIQFTKTEISFLTNGEVGEISVSIPSRSLQMESIKCTEEIEFTYQLPLLQRMTSALMFASKVIIRADERGVLSCQFIVEYGDGRSNYIEFLTVPTEEEEDDEK